MTDEQMTELTSLCYTVSKSVFEETVEDALVFAIRFGPVEEATFRTAYDMGVSAGVTRVLKSVRDHTLSKG